MLNITPEEIGRLSPQERLALIELLWDSLDDSDLPVPPAQRAELQVIGDRPQAIGDG
jgi:hypothetical protein